MKTYKQFLNEASWTKVDETDDAPKGVIKAFNTLFKGWNGNGYGTEARIKYNKEVKDQGYWIAATGRKFMLRKMTDQQMAKQNKPADKVFINIHSMASNRG